MHAIICILCCNCWASLIYAEVGHVAWWSVRKELNWIRERRQQTDNWERIIISLRSEKIFGWFSELDSPHSKMIKVNINLCKTTSIMWSSIWSLPQQYLKVRTNENIIYLAASSIFNIKNISTFSIPTLILSCGLIIISCSCKSGCSNLLEVTKEGSYKYLPLNDD